MVMRWVGGVAWSEEGREEGRGYEMPWSWFYLRYMDG